MIGRRYLCLFLMILPTFLYAETGGRVIKVGIGGVLRDDRLAEDSVKIEEWLIKKMERGSSKVTLGQVPVTPLHDSEVDDNSRKIILDNGRRKLGDAIARVEKNDISEAILLFQGIESELEPLLPYNMGFPEFVRATLYLGVCYYSRHALESALDSFLTALTLNPSATLDFTKDKGVIEFFGTFKKNLLKKQMGKWKINFDDSDYDDAAIFIDGKRVVATKGVLMSGSHYVYVMKDGFSPFRDRMTIVPNETAKLTAHMIPRSTLAEAYLTPESDIMSISTTKWAVLKKMQHDGSYDYIMLAKISKTKNGDALLVQFVDTTSRRATKIMGTALRDDDLKAGIQEFVSCISVPSIRSDCLMTPTEALSDDPYVLLGDLNPVTNGRSGDVDIRVDDDPFYKKWWFLTIAGGILIGSGAGYYLTKK